LALVSGSFSDPCDTVFIESGSRLYGEFGSRSRLFGESGSRIFGESGSRSRFLMINNEKNSIQKILILLIKICILLIFRPLKDFSAKSDASRPPKRTSGT
jgi:hypothetical protein